MLLSSIAEGAPADCALLKRLDALCNEGLFLQAQALLPDLAGNTTEELLMHARITGHLGAMRSSEAALARMWRRDRNDPDTATAYLRSVLHRKGPYRAWRLLQDTHLPVDIFPDQAAEWLSTQARLYSLLRDFERAQQCFDRAIRLAPDNLWIATEWSYVCEARDQYGKAIDIARDVLKKKPDYRSGIQALAHFLALTGQDDEALDLLTPACSSMESAYLACQLFDMQFERGLYREADETLHLCGLYAPLADKQLKRWIAARRADVALRTGDMERARNEAQQAGTAFYSQIAERISASETSARRVLLPVGFVRQHYMTCVPATLAALSGYWNRPADHLEIAEKICYDGTSHHSERTWAEERGFIAREFTVDWDNARALIDAGVPFTLATVYTAGGHLQAVIGYDELRGVLLIRDPFERTHGEFLATAFFESHQSAGPRGMVLIPPDEVHRIEGINLLDAELWDEYHALAGALQLHDRDAAASAASRLDERDAAHRLALNARRAIAMYDGDEPAILASTEALLALYPDDSNLQLSKATSLGLIGTRDERLEWLARISEAQSNDAQILVRHAGALQEDERQSAVAEKLLHRALSCLPTGAAGWYEWANLQWQRNNKEVSLECYRIASCLQETNEHYASTYFRAGVFLKRFDDVIAHLTDRHARFGHKSAQPLITWFTQMEMLERTDEAFDLLQKELARYPKNADLVLFAADTYLRYGKISTADVLLKNFAIRARPASWLRTQATLAREMNEPGRALQLAKEAVALEPLNTSLHRLVASLTAQIQGRSEAIAYLKGVCERFSHHCGLHEMLVGWMQDEPLSAIEPVLRHLIATNPGNLWAQRELASNLARQQRFEEANEVIGIALKMGPTHSYNHSTQAFVCFRQGHVPQARQHLRQALIHSIDNEYALNMLLDWSGSFDERREALAFVKAELVRQVTLGDALMSFQSAAKTTLAAEDLTAVLQDALQHRPDLWQAWVALGIQLADAGKLPEAIAHLEQTVQKFPLLPRAYVELANVQVLNGNRRLAIETLSEVLRVNPYWIYAVRSYVNYLLDEGTEPERALKALDTALARSPEDAELLALRANTLSFMRRNDEALSEIRKAIKSNPSLSWPWGLLRRVADECRTPELTEQVARDLTVTHAGSHWSWIRLAQALRNMDEALAAADKAVSLDPGSQTAFETRLDLLLRAGRHEELKSALRNTPWDGYAPASVRVYEARLSRATGDMKAAMAKMRELLETDADNYSLWGEYADWCDQAEHYKDYLHAAENMLRLNGNYHIAHGYLADALSKLNRAGEAKPHLERAFELDPSYTFAGYRLLDDAIDKQNPDRARAILMKLQLHAEGPVLNVRRVKLAVLTNRPDDARGAVREIISHKDVSEWACKTAIQSMVEKKWQEPLIEEIKNAVVAGQCAPDALRFLIDEQGKGWAPSIYRDMKKLFALDSSHILKAEFLSWLGASKNLDLLDRFVKEYRSVLTGNLMCWCLGGYAYVTVDQNEKAVEWMSDWRRRPDVPSWALDNLALALRNLRQHDLAKTVSLRSLECEPDNIDARIWLAVDAARNGDHDELVLQTKAIGARQARPYYKELLEIVKRYHEAATAGDPASALEYFRKIRREAAPSRVARNVMTELRRRLTAGCSLPKRLFYWLRYGLS